MEPRVQLQTLLEGLLRSHNVYFQPPETLKMQYPCIVYKLDDIKQGFADNLPYSTALRYQMTLIHSDPDSELVCMIIQLPMCKFVTAYTANNLHHTVYDIYY